MYIVHENNCGYVFSRPTADKKTAVGVVEGNLDEARELVSPSHVSSVSCDVSSVSCDVHYCSSYM